jgi:hypothetical protein
MHFIRTMKRYDRPCSSAGRSSISALPEDATGRARTLRCSKTEAASHRHMEAIPGSRNPQSPPGREGQGGQSLGQKSIIISKAGPKCSSAAVPDEVLQEEERRHSMTSARKVRTDKTAQAGAYLCHQGVFHQGMQETALRGRRGPWCPFLPVTQKG